LSAMGRGTPPAAEVLGIVVEHSDDRTVCRIRGDLDAINAPRLRAVLGECLDRDVVVDLSAVEFIDSSGLGALVGALKRFAASGHRLTLRAPTSAIRRVFAVTGLAEAFVVED
jgi:anti-sigma B factor antagonist